MGTLQQIRKISPYVFGIFAFLLVAFFTLGDPTVIDGLRGALGSSSSQVIGKVNGVEIMYVDYETRVREEEENQRRQMAQQGQNTEIDNNMIRQRVWDMMVDEILLKQQLEHVGILISNKTISEQMIDNPPDFLKKSFSDSLGNFNRQLYVELVTNPENYAKYLGEQMPVEQKQEAIAQFRKDLINIEKYLRQTMQQQELQTAITASKGLITPGFAEMMYKNENSIANGNFIGLSLRDVPQDKLEIPKEEIEKYYNANKQYFKQKAQRKLKYIAIAIQPSAEDSARAQKRIDNIKVALASALTNEEKDSIFEIKLNEYSGVTYDYKMVSDVDPQILNFFADVPTRGMVGPIYMPDGTVFLRLDDKRSGQKVVVKASHILISLNNNNDSAKAEANKIFAEVTTGKEPFEDAAFAAKVGELVGPVETQFGYHIIKVVDRKSEDLKYSEIKISTSVSSSTRSQIFRNAKSIEQQCQAGASLDSLAKKLKLRFAESPLFQNNTPVLGSRFLSAIAFQNEVGTVIEPTELPRFGVVIAQVSEIKEAGISPLDDVRMEISQKLGKIKQLNNLQKKATEIYNKVKNYNTLSEAVNADTTLKQYFRTLNEFKYAPAIPGFGQDAAFAPKLFSLPLNKISEPVRGENSYFIMEVSSKKVPSNEEIKGKLGDFIQGLQLQAKNSVYYQWFQSVKEKSTIDDYRSKFYKDF